jgi:hypothetical protein
MTYMPPMFEDFRRRWRRMDRIVRMMIFHWALGMGLGAVLAAGLLGFDFLGLRSLLWRSNIAVAGTVMFVGMFALTFGGVVAATAAMRAGRDDDEEPRGGLKSPALIYATAPRGAR